MKILICDNDDFYSAESEKAIRNCAKKHGIPVTIHFTSSGENLAFFIDTKYKGTDLVLLEYDLPKMSGMEAARALRASGYVGDIAFYTFNDSHIAEGYEVDAIAYVIKGRESIEKLESLFLKSAGRSNIRQEDCLTVSCHNETRRIPTSYIVYFEVRDHLVTVHYVKSNKIEIFEFHSTLKQLSEQLSHEKFWRCHKSFLMNKEFIYRTTSDEIEMRNGDIIPKTQKLKQAFRAFKNRFTTNYDTIQNRFDTVFYVKIMGNSAHFTLYYALICPLTRHG